MTSYMRYRTIWIGSVPSDQLIWRLTRLIADSHPFRVSVHNVYTNAMFALGERKRQWTISNCCGDFAERLGVVHGLDRLAIRQVGDMIVQPSLLAVPRLEVASCSTAVEAQ